MIDVIFALINFGIFTLLAVYVYLYYVAPSIHHSIHEQQVAHDRLIAQRTKLREACRDVEKQLAQQEREYHTLTEKMSQWSSALQEIQHEQQQAAERMRERIRTRMYQQQQYRQRRKALKQSFPHALEQARAHLKKYYNADRGRAYIQHSVKHMERKHV